MQEDEWNSFELWCVSGQLSIVKGTRHWRIHILPISIRLMNNWCATKRRSTFLSVSFWSPLHTYGVSATSTVSGCCYRFIFLSILFLHVECIWKSNEQHLSSGRTMTTSMSSTTMASSAKVLFGTIQHIQCYNSSFAETENRHFT